MTDKLHPDAAAINVYLERSSICVAALEGIDDPEAFMRDVRESMDEPITFGKILALYGRVTSHLKGKDHE